MNVPNVKIKLPALTDKDKEDIVFGVKQGFDLEMLDALASRVSVPIIASGGAGKMEDFAQLFTHPGIDAGLAASIFHTRQVDIKELKRYLRAQGVEMRI